MEDGFARLKSANDPPPGRWGHSLTTLDDRRLVLFVSAVAAWLGSRACVSSSCSCGFVFLVVL